MRDYVFAPSARDDLQAITSYLRDAAGAEVARAVVFRIRDRCSLLAETAGTLGAAREDILAELRSLPIPPYVLFFRYGDVSVEIVRILHGRRDINRIFDEDE
ncbi:MAG: type II toxin-antitoxin system RelE/ParE family toxin [Bradymonadaceae bacterium]|nr:type II toxin-antitoxin system RelE/ParE family toxin [Lujinxingiaceae bacterium]